MAEYSTTPYYSGGGRFYNPGQISSSDAALNAARMQAAAQNAATQQQQRAAEMAAQTARYQADLQHQAAMAPLEFEKQKYNTLLSQLFGVPMPGSAGGFAGPGGQSQRLIGGGLFQPGAAGGGQVGIQPFPMPGDGLRLGGGGQQAALPEIDETLPQFSADPFSTSATRRAMNAAHAASQRQLGTEMRNINTSAAARGFGANSPQVQAMQSRARQASRASDLTEQRGIQERAGMGSAQLEQQRQGLLAQRRTDIGKTKAQLATAQYGPQAQLYSTLLGKL